MALMEKDMTTFSMQELMEKARADQAEMERLYPGSESYAAQKIAGQIIDAPVKPVETEYDRQAADRAERFSAAYLDLEAALPWLRQPRKALNYTFENFKASTPEQARALKAARLFASRLMKRVITGENSEVGILFLGTTGTGKTHLAKAILTDLRAQKIPGFFIPASEYFDLYTPSYAAGLDRPLWKIRQWLASVSCLVIDEVGTASWTDSRKDRLQQIIDLRTENKLPTIVTTNLNAVDFKQAGADRIVSRFSQVLYPIKCTWDDYRKSVKAKEIDEVF